MKRLKMLFLVVLLTSLVSTKAYAITFEDNGIYYETVTASGVTYAKVVRPNNVTYTGKVVIPNDVTIPGETPTSIPVKEINGYVFNGSSITEVSIGSNIQTVGNHAFSNCEQLIKAHFESLNALCSISFGDQYSNPLSASQCHLYIDDSKITDIDVPTTIKTIGQYAFAGSKIKSVNIPSTVTKIGKSAFIKCDSLKKSSFASLQSLCAIDFDDQNSNPLYLTNEIYVKGSSNSITSVAIPSGSLRLVNGKKTIGGNILAGAKYLINVEIPTETDSIGNNAFDGCEGLEVATFSSKEKVISIIYGNDKANPLFYAKNLVVGGKIVTDYEVSQDVPENTFINSNWLEKVTFNDNVKHIGKNAFKFCSNLKTVVLPSSLLSIGEGAFFGCRNLSDITLPESLLSIGKEAFRDCNKFSSIIIPQGCTNLGDGIFSYCTNIKTVRIESSVSEIPALSFASCYNLSDITIPESIKKIGERAFENCGKLSSMPFSNSLEYISYRAFANCMGITSLVLSEKGDISTIKGEAFYGCNNIMTITFPASISLLEDKVFDGCNKLEEVFCLSETVPTTASNTFGENPSNITLYVNSEAARTEYLKQEPWSLFKECVVMKTCTLNFYVNDLEIGSVSQQAGSVIETSSIPVVALEENEFFSGWNEEIPQSMPNEDKNFYGYKSAIAEVDGFFYHLLPSEKLNGKNLENRAVLTGVVGDTDWQVVVSEQVTYKNTSYTVETIGRNAFSEKNNIEEIKLPSTINQIDNAAFYRCTGLNRVLNFPKDIETISDSLFLNCTSLAQIQVKDQPSNTNSLPANLKIIGKHAFEGCTNFCLTTLPTTLTAIKYQAFSGSGIEHANITSSADLEEEVFKECKNLKEVVFDENFNFPLSKLLFWNCSNLEKVTLGNALTSINESAFMGCNKLDNVVIPASVTFIGSKAFAQCGHITQLTVERDEPPFASVDSFDEEVYDTTNFYVNDINAYQEVMPWSNFKNMIVRKNYSLFYVLDGDNYQTVTSLAGSGINPMPIPSHQNRKFSGWRGEPAVMPAKDSVIVGAFQYSLDYFELSESGQTPLFKDRDRYLFYGDVIEIPVGDLHRTGYKFTITYCSDNSTTPHFAVVVEEDNAADTVILMPKYDLNALVKYEKTEYEKTLDGVNYKMMTLDTHAEVVSSTRDHENIIIPKTIDYEGTKFPVTIIQDNAFKGDKIIKTIVLPEFLDSIGYQAFSNSNIQEIDIPSSVTKMGTEVFLWCSQLKEVNMNANVTTIPSRTFQNCVSLKNVELNNNVTVIDEYAFEGCTDLRSITLPSNLQEIKERAFWATFSEGDTIIVSGTQLPVGEDNIFDQPAYDTAVLRTSVTQMSAPWNNFVNVEQLEGGTETPQCAKPVISYEGGKVKFSCATPGVTIVSEVSVNDVQKSTSTEIELSKTYVVTAYAKRVGYRKSEIATKTFTWMVGDANNDGVVDIADAVQIVNFVVGKIDALGRKMEIDLPDPE